MRVEKKWWPLIAVGTLVAGIVAYQYTRSSMLSFDCIHRVLSEAASPDGDYVATISERSCGAVTHDYRVVSIRRRRNRFKGEDHKAWVFWMEYQPEIKVSWSGQRQLAVFYPAATGKKVEVERWQDVTIVEPRIQLDLLAFLSLDCSITIHSPKFPIGAQHD